jgi:formylglycine-generating enzyme required for sulfatase activity
MNAGTLTRIALALTLLGSSAAFAMDQTIVVLPLDLSKAAGKMSPEARASVEEMIRDEAISQLPGWTVLSGETTIKKLEDNGVDPSKCGDGSCHLETARMMTVPMFISGSIQFIEGTYTASIRLIDTKSGQILAATSFESAKILGLRVEFRKGAPEFFARAGLLGGGNGSANAASAPSPAPANPGNTAQAQGVLKVVSSPSGAKVSIDGDPAGSAPLTVKKDAGTYVVTLELPGFAPVSRTVELQAGRSAVVNEKLMQAAGYLDISIAPAAAASGARVTVDGVAAGTGKQGPYKVGKHTIAAQSAGYRGTEASAEVESGGTNSVPLTLEALPGKLLLSVNVAADCASGLARVHATAESLAKLEVPAGRAHVVCSAEGRDDASADIEVAPGKAVTVTLELKHYTGPTAGKTRVETKSGLEFVYIPPGTFHEGCEPQDKDCYDNEKPGHTASVRALWLGKTDVTVAAYKKCIAAGACEDISNDDDQHRCNLKNGRLDHPMNCLDWKSAQTFCSWVGGRLPSAEEWEYAAKSGESRIFPWGNAAIDSRRANVCDKRCKAANPSLTADESLDDGYAATSPVGAFPAGASKWGLLDMAGNVWQWTSTDYDASNKELRGGSWSNHPQFLRVSLRFRLVPSNRNVNVGFRCGL